MAKAMATETPTRCDEYFPAQKGRAKPPLNKVPIPKELIRDHGFAQMPKKFNILVTLFNEMEKILQNVYGREQRKTFAELSANVEKNCKKKFTEKHLAQIASVYPAAYTLHWEPPKGKRTIQLLWDLVIHPNLQGNKDLAPFIDNFLAIPLLDDRPKMDANRLKWRKLIFRHKLVSRVREAHAKFLIENKLQFADDDPQCVHPKFKEAIEEIVDQIPTDGAIPLRRKMNNSPGRNLQSTDIRTFLQSIECKTPISERDKTPERHPPSALLVSKSEPCTPQTAAKANPSLKFEPITPKTPLEERLKAKFAANEAAIKAGLPEMQKRRAMLHKLESEGGKSILEVIRAHLNLEQRYSVGLADPKLLQKMGREISAASLLEHLQLLCELVSSSSKSTTTQTSTKFISASNPPPPSSKCCWLESVGRPPVHYFKISREIGPKWIETAKKAITEELASLETKMRGLHRSPSSCF